MGPLSLVIGVLAACFLTGAVPALVPRLKPYLQERLGIDAHRLDRIERMQFFLAWAIAMPLGGLLADVWNPKDVLFLGAGGVAVTLALFGVANTQQWIGVMSFLLGCATSLLAVSTLVLAPHAFPDLVPAAGMNLAFVAVGIGSFAPQLMFARFERLLGFKNTLLVLGLSALIPAGLVLFAAAPARQTSDVVFYHDLRYWLLGLALIFYLPIESALDVWSEPFLNELGYRERSGRMMLIGFWIAFLAARIGMAVLIGPRNELWLLMLCVLVSAVVLGNLVGAYGASAGALGFWLVGAAYGPLLPTFLGLLVEAFPANPGVVVGSLFAVAGIHDALFQPVFHRFTHTRPVRVSMRIPLVMTLLMLAPLLMIGLMR